METIEGYKINREEKKDIMYCRMDDTMIKKLREIREVTGISTSELIRESVRRFLKESEKNGSVEIKI
jgi:Ribbon-helix-helix protein, copG family.